MGANYAANLKAPRTFIKIIFVCNVFYNVRTKIIFATFDLGNFAWQPFEIRLKRRYM